MFLLASNTLFATRQPDLPLWYRAYVHTVFHYAMPLFIPFSLFPKLSEAGTADALRRACSCIERGFNPLTSWGRGTAIMATECQLPVLPIRLLPNARGGMTVMFLPLVMPRPTRTSAELHALVANAHASLQT
jgi:hypothetical protein